MKIVIILVAVLIILGGGAAGALYFMEIGPFAPPPAAEDGELPAEPPTTMLDLDNTAFMDMDTLVIPILGGERSRSFYIDIRIELASRDRSGAAAQRVRLHDAFLRDMFVFLPQHLKQRDTVDLNAVKGRLLYITQQILGSELARDVLIQAAYER